MEELRGKIAVVTGASRGIGAATARELAARGVKVVLGARSADAIEAVAGEIRESGGDAVAQACDVANCAEVEALIRAAVDTFGRLDILVNNAGVIEPITRLADSDPAAWDAALDINAKGVYHGLRAALPLMARQGTGIVVNVSSGAATNPLEGWSHYCAGKAAALMLTRCADLEYHDQGIRVVGMSPGTVATEMQVQIKASGVNPVSQLDPAVHIPPEWAARAIAWLCTDAARDFHGVDFALRDADNRRRVGLIT
jgi:NAD(P)-dependent dehydrogenase (short-subunit alcohol dehydrogenase family)